MGGAVITLCGKKKKIEGVLQRALYFQHYSMADDREISSSNEHRQRKL
jgi:hypothetical protein